MTDTDALTRLHATLVSRETPETVAQIVREALPEIRKGSLGERLRQMINLSTKARFGWSSMSDRFQPVVGAERQIDKARELALLFLGETLPEGADAAALDAVAGQLSHLIGRTPGQARFDADRLDKAGRRDAGLTLSRRRYDKLFRLVGRLEAKARRMQRQEENLALVLVGKSALAPRLSLDDFAGHVPSAAFVAYLSARMKLRSEFTISGQQRAFDHLAAALLAQCERDPKTSWWAIAHIFPRADVLARLTDEQKGRLLGQWFDILSVTAERLVEASERTSMDLETMIVRRGDDSSTWNLLAGAFNRARDHWIALVAALDADALFDAMMPGKVLRLMAADVAAWHRETGGGVHPDTVVWKTLPRPWLVLRGEQVCTQADIVSACETAGVDPVKSGWSAARPRTSVATFRPTPELVHGVSVNNPYFAAYLRQGGVFSGKALKVDKL